MRTSRSGRDERQEATHGGIVELVFRAATVRPVVVFVTAERSTAEEGRSAAVRSATELWPAPERNSATSTVRPTVEWAAIGEGGSVASGTASAATVATAAAAAMPAATPALIAFVKCDVHLNQQEHKRRLRTVCQGKRLAEGKR